MKAIMWCIHFAKFAGQDEDKSQQMVKQAEKELHKLQTLLEGIYQWDTLDTSADGKKWRQEIEKLLINSE